MLHEFDGLIFVMDISYLRVLFMLLKAFTNNPWVRFHYCRHGVTQFIRLNA